MIYLIMKALQLIFQASYCAISSNISYTFFFPLYFLSIFYLNILNIDNINCSLHHLKFIFFKLNYFVKVTMAYKGGWLSSMLKSLFFFFFTSNEKKFHLIGTHSLNLQWHWQTLKDHCSLTYSSPRDLKEWSLSLSLSLSECVCIFTSAFHTWKFK